MATNSRYLSKLQPRSFLEMCVDDVDGVYQRAVDAGAEPRIPFTNTFLEIGIVS